MEPIDLDEAAGQGRLRRWFDFHEEDGTIGAVRADATAEAAAGNGVSSCGGEPASEPAAAAAAVDTDDTDDTCTDEVRSATPVLTATLLVGLHVRMLFSSAGRFPGVVHEMLGNGNLLVKFNDGERKDYNPTEVRSGLVDKLMFQVSFQWKNPGFLLKNPDFILKNPDYLIQQRVSHPFSIGRKRVKHFDGTIVSHGDGHYRIGTIVSHGDGHYRMVIRLSTTMVKLNVATLRTTYGSI